MNLDNKVTLITGAGSGIGAASAKAFAAKGARVAVVDINQAGAEQVASDIGSKAYACDVSNEAAVNELVKKVEADFGNVDILFNNAGIATGSDIMRTDIDVWQHQWNVNVMSHVYTTRAVFPKMLERGDGYLIQTASMAGYLTSQGLLTYAVTKHAVVGFAEWMSITYHDKGVRTSLLAPLGVATPMLESISGPLAEEAAGPVKSPEEVADMVVDAVEKEQFLILTDEIAKTWMDYKNNDIERWLSGMRRLQSKFDAARAAAKA